MPVPYLLLPPVARTGVVLPGSGQGRVIHREQHVAPDAADLVPTGCNGLAPRQVRRYRWLTTTATMVMLVPTAEAVLVWSVWRTCDLGGINASVTDLTVARLLWPALLISHAIVLGGIYIVASRTGSRSHRWLGLVLQVGLVIVGAS